MPKQLVIAFSEEATEKYLALCRASTEAHLEADMEPAFPSLRVDLDIIDSLGYLTWGGEDIELGEVVANVVDKNAQNI